MRSASCGLPKNKRKTASGKGIKTTLYDLLGAIDKEIKDDRLVRQIVMQLLASGKIRSVNKINQELVCA